MEAVTKINCESNLSSSHGNIFYYCAKCKEILCNECLIIHLCQITHDTNALRKVEDALVLGKETFISLHEHIKRQNVPLPVVEGTNPVEKLMAQKEIDSTKLFDGIQSQMLGIQENLTRFYSLFKKKIEQNDDNITKEEMDQVSNELGQIGSSWETFDLNQKINYLKAFSQYEKRSKDLIALREKNMQKSQNKSIKDKEMREINKIVDDIGFIGFSNWLRKQGEALNQRINTQISKIEKSMVDNDNVSDEEMDTTQNNVIPAKPISNKGDNEPIKAKDGSNHKPNGSSMNHNVKSNSHSNSIESHTPLKSSQVGETQMFQYPYQGKCLFAIKRKENSNPIEVLCYMNKKVSVIQINPANFIKCFSTYFPFRNHKSVNLGESLLITGGCIDSTITNQVFILQFDQSNQIKILAHKDMLFNRESHNILFIPKINTVMVCCGQMNTTCEKIDLSSLNNTWQELPVMNSLRANGTMALLNETIAYCIGGYNNQDNTYANGFEYLDLNNTSPGWKNIVLKESLAISTMGIISLSKNSALLLGGFEGGKKYLQNGIVFESDDNPENIKIEKKENLLSKGLIFYSSPVFFKIDDEILNFDFKLGVIAYDPVNHKTKMM